MQPTAIVDFQEARDFGGKMNALYIFLRQNTKGILKCLLFFAAPFVLLSSALSHDLINTMIANTTSGGMYGPSPLDYGEYYSSTTFWLRMIATWIVSLIGGVFTISTVFSYVMVYEEKQSQQIEISAVWKKIKSQFWTNFVNLFAYTLGFFATAFLLVIPLSLLTTIATFLGPFVIIIAAISYYIFIISLAIYFAMALFISIKERIDYFSAIGRLFKLAKDRFWNTAFFGGVNLYIQLILTVIFIIPYYLYLYLVQLHSVDMLEVAQPSAFQEILGMILLMIYSLVSILLASLPLTAITVQYYYLLEHKEARGLMKKIDNFHVSEITATDEHEDF